MGSTCAEICVLYDIAGLGASRSPYELRYGRGCLVVRSFKSVVVSRVTCAQDSGSMGIPHVHTFESGLSIHLQIDFSLRLCVQHADADTSYFGRSWTILFELKTK